MRTHKLLVTLILLIVMVSLGGASDVTYVSLRSQADRLQGELTTKLSNGQEQLEAGKDGLKEANINHDAALVDGAIEHFAAAKEDFLSASRLADSSNFLRYLEYVPKVGDVARSRHTAVDEIATMGAALSDAGQDLSALDNELIKPSSDGDAGRSFLTVVDQVHAGLPKVRADLSHAGIAAAQVDVQLLPDGQRNTFLKARDSINAAASGFAEFERLTPVLNEVLGGNGSRTYLVEQVNPAELRAGGGFISTYSLLQADHGSLKVIRSGDAYDLVNPRPLPWQAGFIPQPTPYREVIPDTSWSFVDSNIYPDFPSNAQAAENFVQPRVGKVDGVISMDYYTVAEMLKLTGPMYVPGYGFEVDASNFIAQIMRYDVASLDVLRGETHKAILNSLAGPLMQRVSALPPDRWPQLVAMLNDLASHRHLQVYLNNSSGEDEIDRVGWSGRLVSDGQPDFLMEVESNYYGNKSNYWVTRHYSISLTRNGNLLHHQIAVDIVNHEPCGTEERTLYRSDIRLYVSASASSVGNNLIGVRYANPTPPPKTKLSDGWLFVNCSGGHGQAIFNYDTPWPQHDKTGVQIYWQKQPGTVADAVDISWNYATGTIYRVSGNLAQDRVITLLPSGVGLNRAQPAQAVLPSLSL